MIVDLRCMVSGTVVGQIELPDNTSEEEVLRKSYTHSGVVAEGYSLPEPIPQTATPATIRIALRRLYGISTAQLQSVVNAIINSLPTESAREDALDLWEYATSVERTHPLVDAIAIALSLTSEQVDKAFLEASKI